MTDEPPEQLDPDNDDDREERLEEAAGAGDVEVHPAGAVEIDPPDDNEDDA